MPSYRIVQIDAFTDRAFGGNPAAVVPLDAWLPDPTLQSIAAENNLAETAFVMPWAESAGEAEPSPAQTETGPGVVIEGTAPGPGEPAYHLRWFTPVAEVDLCGHATLATASLLFDEDDRDAGVVHFLTRSGWLSVRRSGSLLQLDLPARPAKRVPVEEQPADLAAALGATPIAVWGARDLMVVFDTEAELRALRPDLTAIARWDWFAVVATAPGDDCDFVSRFFAPAQGVPEDPVTGSSHSTLVPYWGDRLNLRSLHARQASSRGGELWCTRSGDRVLISGHAVRFLDGTITIAPDALRD
jgi:PhzF family phenazine biosynthesis protein